MHTQVQCFKAVVVVCAEKCVCYRKRNTLSFKEKQSLKAGFPKWKTKR